MTLTFQQIIESAQPFWNRYGSYNSPKQFSKFLIAAIDTFGWAFNLLNKTKEDVKTNYILPKELVDEVCIFYKKGKECGVERIQKPIEIEKIKEIEKRYSTYDEAYAITVQYPKENNENEQLVQAWKKQLNKDIPEAELTGKIASVTTVLIVYDLTISKIIGMCICPSLYELNYPHKQKLLANTLLAISKLLQTEKERHDRIFFITPHQAGHELEWFIWLIYSLRDSEIKEKIEKKNEITIDQLLTFGKASSFSEKKTGIFRDSTRKPAIAYYSKGMNLDFLYNGKLIQYTFRIDEEKHGALIGLHIHFLKKDEKGTEENIFGAYPELVPILLEKVKEYELLIPVWDIFQMYDLKKIFRDGEEFYKKYEWMFKINAPLKKTSPAEYIETLRQYNILHKINAQTNNEILNATYSIMDKYSSRSPETQQKAIEILTNHSAKIFEIVESEKDEKKAANKITEINRKQLEQIKEFVD